jgi:glutamine amidotransferase
MIVVIDYGAGNIGSILNMFKRLGTDIISSSDPSIIENATKLILPGVGSFDYGVKKLTESGIVDVLNKKVLVDKTPILGICLGVQLMTQCSEEGDLAGLGWFQARTVKFSFSEQQAQLKIPNMGWLDTSFKKNSKIYNHGEEEYRYYHVHSFHLSTEFDSDILCTANYGYEFVSGLEKDNIIGLQFHPEKSHKFGMKIFKNFIDKV